MSYVFDKSWWTHESPGRNPDWWGFKRLLFSKYLNQENWILISQIFSCIWVAMIRVYNFESTAYRLFCELAQYLLSSICLESIRFLSYVWKVTEVYKYIHGLSSEIMNEVFSTRGNIYNARQFNVFETQIPTSDRYGLNSILYKANQLWNLLPENLKSTSSLTLFKNKIKLGQCPNCSCNICNSYVPNLGYCVSRS